VAMGTEKDKDFVFDIDRLAYGKIEGPGVTLAFQADDKAYVRTAVDFGGIKTQVQSLENRKNQSKLSSDPFYLF